MGDDMTEYEEERLELEREKVRLLKKIRKDVKHQQSLENLAELADRLDIGRDDIDGVVRFVGDKLKQHADEDDD